MYFYYFGTFKGHNYTVLMIINVDFKVSDKQQQRKIKLNHEGLMTM